MQQLQAGALGSLGRVELNQRFVRGLAWFAIAAQLVFTAAWIVAAASEPGYSVIDQYVSELGARDAANAWIVNAAFLVLGASVLALAPGLAASLPKRRARAVAIALFVLAGLLMAGNGLFQLDCAMTDQSCKDQFDAGALSWQHSAHLWTSLLFQLAIAATPFVLARALWPEPVAQLALLAGVAGLVIGFGAYAVGGDTDGPNGVVQRAELLTVHVWLVIVAVGILHSTRAAPAFSDLIPMRARDFFHGSWEAEGELAMKPAWLWRRLASPLRIRRRSTALGDDIWKVEDVAEFEDGRRMVRRYYCELTEPSRVHVTGDDMPDGAELRLEEGGYRIAPYRLAVPVGPVRFTLLCRDLAEPLAGGGVHGTIDMSWLGIPVARLSATVRPRP